MKPLGRTIRSAALADLGSAMLTGTAVGATTDLTRYVNPFNGTQQGAKNFGTGGGAGNTFPGTTWKRAWVHFS